MAEKSRLFGEGQRTNRGDLVRSKSEAIIADQLYARRIDYAYEQPPAWSPGECVTVISPSLTAFAGLRTIGSMVRA